MHMDGSNQVNDNFVDVSGERLDIILQINYSRILFVFNLFNKLLADLPVTYNYVN